MDRIRKYGTSSKTLHLQVSVELISVCIIRLVKFTWILFQQSVCIACTCVFCIHDTFLIPEGLFYTSLDITASV